MVAVGLQLWSGLEASLSRSRLCNLSAEVAWQEHSRCAELVASVVVCTIGVSLIAHLSLQFQMLALVSGLAWEDGIE